MTGPGAALAGRILLAAALVAAAGGAVFLAGVVPGTRGVNQVVGGALLLVAATDAGLGWWLISRGK